MSGAVVEIGSGEGEEKRSYSYSHLLSMKSYKEMLSLCSFLDSTWISLLNNIWLIKIGHLGVYHLHVMECIWKRNFYIYIYLNLHVFRVIVLNEILPESTCFLPTSVFRVTELWAPHFLHVEIRNSLI